MKKTFDFMEDEEKYILKNTNPNVKSEAFTIQKKEMQFDTNQFYQYVFADVNSKMEVDIIDKANGNDASKRIYGIILEITNSVMKQMNIKCFDDNGDIQETQ